MMGKHPDILVYDYVRGNKIEVFEFIVADGAREEILASTIHDSSYGVVVPKGIDISRTEPSLL